MTDQIDLDAIEARVAAYQQHRNFGFACCSAHPVAEAAAALVAEVRRLRARVEQLDRALGETIDDRDQMHEIADKLAYAVAPEEVIGEHSSMNDPWTNALELITPKIEVDKLRQQVAAVTAVHEKGEHNGLPICLHCASQMFPPPETGIWSESAYPCATLRALDITDDAAATASA